MKPVPRPSAWTQATPGSGFASDTLPPIYLVCHRHDYFLARIAVASIRYYYPSVEINLVPDNVNGTFDTSDLERYFDVKILRLGSQTFGWTSAKMLLLLTNSIPPGTKFIMMDADVVLVGKVLDSIWPHLKQYDFVVSPEFSHQQGTTDFARTYYDAGRVLRIHPDFRFPGFTFNTGCIGATAGALSLSEIRPFFDPESYPYWSQLAAEVLPTRDQSLLNILLPMKQRQAGGVLQSVEFMWWFLQSETAALHMDEVKTGQYPRVVHWAGGRRVPHVGAMVRGDILRFFQRQYYKRLPRGGLRYFTQVCKDALTYHLWFYPAHWSGIRRIPDWTTRRPNE